MKKQINDERTGLTYTLVGDCYMPNFKVDDKSYNIGVWGERRREFLKNYRKPLYSYLQTTLTLLQHLEDIETEAQKMYDVLIKQLAEKENITEQLKADNQILWVQRMNEIAARTREIVFKEIIYR